MRAGDVYRSLDEHIELMEAFLSGRLSVDRFERQYLDLYSSDATLRGDAIFRVIDDVFFAVDEYCGDPDLRGEYDIDEDQLRDRVRAALSALADLKAAV